MARVRELIAAIEERHPTDAFFADYVESCRVNEGKKRAYRTYDDALRVLDVRSWRILKDKAVRHFRDHRAGQRKQGFFNQLNEAFAYRWLVRRGCAKVQMLAEGTSTTPDIRYVENDEVKHCEVKTLGLSDDEIRRRRTGGLIEEGCYERLSQGLLNKLSDSVGRARAQISAQGTDGFVYVVLLWDDSALDHYQDHRRQLISYCRQSGIDNIYIKIA